MDYTNFDILNNPPDTYVPLDISGNDTHYYVATISDRQDSNAYPLAIAFDRLTMEPTEYFSWATIPFPYTSLLDIEVTNDYFIGLFGEYNSGLDRWLHLTARSFADLQLPTEEHLLVCLRQTIKICLFSLKTTI